jgi:hypothetical protein
MMGLLYQSMNGNPFTAGVPFTLFAHKIQHAASQSKPKSCNNRAKNAKDNRFVGIASRD